MGSFETLFAVNMSTICIQRSADMKRTKIEWVKNPDGTQGYTVNPLKGQCQHKCWYCYAERIRTRFKKPAEMSWHPEVFKDIKKIEEPSSFFMGSAYDIFGDWVDEELIGRIFDCAEECHRHNFIFLTKNPKRFSLYNNYVRNCWFGYSDNGREENHYNWRYFRDIPEKRRFVSFEPLLGSKITIDSSANWIIVGALTGHNGQPVSPVYGGTYLEWVLPIIEYADKCKIPLFLKDNLLKLHPELPKRQEVPWVE